MAAPQQTGILGAAWYVAALAYAAQGGAARITLCDVSGTTGLVSDDGVAYPVYSALMAVGTATGGKVQPVTISDPLDAACLAVVSADGAWQDIYVVNLQPQTTSVVVSGVLGTSARVRTIDETTNGDFSAVLPVPVVDGSLPISLLPYAVAQIISGSAVG